MTRMMFTPDEMSLLVACMRRNGVAELEIEQDLEIVRLVGAAGVRPNTPTSPRKSTQTISARAFGVLHLHEAVGAALGAGDIIASVAAGPLRRPVVSPVAGTLIRILGRQDQRVEYGTPLFEIAAP